MTSNTYLHTRLEIDTTTNEIAELDLITGDLAALSSELKDETFDTDVTFLRSLADEALRNDPIVGISNYMPGTQRAECLRAECELGNLVADSLRWQAYADIAFIASQSIAGPGWPFGDVRVSDVWQTIPEPKNMCKGTMSGLSLFKFLDTAIGSKGLINGMLQISGFKVVYNSQLKDSSPIVSVRVWDMDKKEYQDLDRLRLYTFATDDSLCAAAGPFSSLLGGSFVIAGEEAGIIDDTDLLQNIIGDYLKTGTTYYVPQLEDRLTNNLEAKESLDNDFEINGKCPNSTYWDIEKQTCFSCPSEDAQLIFSDELLEITAAPGNNVTQGRVVLVNRDLHDFLLLPSDNPSWVELTGGLTSTNVAIELDYDTPFRISSGESIALDFAVDASNVGVGVRKTAVSFLVTDPELFSGCSAENRVAAFELRLNVQPPQTLVHLGRNAIYGYLAMTLVFTSCIVFGVWAFLNRKVITYGDLGDKSIKSVQPLYLNAICFGIFVMAMTIIPLSFDDSEEDNSSSLKSDKMCLVAPWLLSLGLSITLSALISKFGAARKVSLIPTPNLREIVVSGNDLLKHFSFLFIVNFGILFFTLMEPPRWLRKPDEDLEWRIYGSCEHSELGSLLQFASFAVYILALLYTCFHAYRASTNSDHFKAIRSDACAVLMWLQIVIIAVPIWFSIDESRVITRYYFEVSIVAALCFSMILCIFAPVIKKKRDAELALHANSKKSKVAPATPERHDDNESFLGFLGFSGGSRQGSNRGTEIPDEESIQQEEKNRCLADRFCY
jgi:hypothetical protein